MAVLRDSLWVAEDFIAGGSLGVQQTFTQDVLAFTYDVNDPYWTMLAPVSQGIRTAWLKAVLPTRYQLTLDTLTTDYDTVLTLWTWDGATATLLTWNDDYSGGTSRISYPAAAGTYLIGVSQKTSDAVNTDLVLHATFAATEYVSAGLLLRGVGSNQFASARPFDVGGIGLMTSERPFDLLWANVHAQSNRPFDISGPVGKTSSRPFDLGTGGLLVTSPRPFDIIDLSDGQAITPVVYVPPSVDPVDEVQRVLVTATGGVFTLTFDGSTTGSIAWDASAATVQSALEALPNIAPGDVTVTSTSDGYLVAFGGAYAGLNVPALSIASYLTGTATVAQVIVVQPGSPAGAGASLSGIQVYDKTGSRLGAITTFSLTNPPSRAINFRGACAFTMPRVLVDETSGTLYPNPDVELIPDDEYVRGDRLVVIGDSSRASDPWGGVITNIEFTDGAVIVQCADVMDLLSTPQLPEDNEARATKAILIPEDTPAVNIVSLLMSHANVWFGANEEVLWGLDASGSNTFFGRETMSGTVEGALAQLVERSFGEWAWRIELTPTSMTPVLVWRDKFLAGTGPALTDGDDGNVVAGPSLSLDLTTVINAIRITGAVTKVESLLPEGATALPYAELIPVAEVWWPTEGYRRRWSDSGAGTLLNVEVPFTLEEDTQEELAAAEEAKRRAMFESFIHAFHCQFGRPWHDGWSWAGGAGNDESVTEPEDFERTLTADRYIHYRALAANSATEPTGDISGLEPIAVVMKGTSAGTATRSGSSVATMNYTVVRGDTLWAIAERFYGTPYKWPELYQLNKTVIDRTAKAHGFTSNFAHWIFPGEVLKVPTTKSSTSVPAPTTTSGGTDGRFVVVKYDRVNAIQKVWSTVNVVELPDETIFAFEWRRYKQGDYDPASDGIGVESPFKTVKGSVIQEVSWRVVPWGGGGSGSTQLAFGITASATRVPVVSIFPLPTAYPYIVTVGSDEKMLVTGVDYNVLIVVRGYDGTTASIHERGETVEYIVDEVAEDEPEPVEPEQPPPQEIPWPAGEAYAQKLLERLHRPKRVRSVRLANVGGDWAEVAVGTQHSVDIQTEGPGGGMTGTVRILGFAPDFVPGSMELILEDVW